MRAAWIEGRCEANGITIRFLRTGGTKPPIVMLHGLLGSGATWTPVARALESDFDVVIPDARGHGGSSAPDHGYRYEDLARDVAGSIDALGLEKPFVLGHSMGGMTAALFASLHPDRLRGLVLVDPTFLTPERQQEVHASDVGGQHRTTLTLTKVDLVAQARARHPKRDPELVELQAEARLATSLAAFEVLVPPNPDYSDVMSAIHVPTLLVIGDDPVVTKAMATEIVAKNAKVELAEIANAGHGLPFEQPERLGEVVRDFLRAHASG